MLLLLKRTRVWFPAPMLGGLQPPTTLAWVCVSECHPLVASGCSCVHTPTQSHTAAGTTFYFSSWECVWDFLFVGNKTHHTVRSRQGSDKARCQKSRDPVLFYLQSSQPLNTQEQMICRAALPSTDLLRRSLVKTPFRTQNALFSVRAEALKTCSV